VRGEGCGEGVDVGEFVFGAQFGGEAGQLEIDVNEFQGELGDVFEDFTGDSRALGSPCGIVDLTPIHNGHEQLAFPIDGQSDQVFDFFGAGAVFEKGDEGAGVEDNTFHSSRSRFRSSRRYLRADGSPRSEPRRLRINSGVSGWRTRRFSSSRKATWVPFLMEYLRRSLEGMTSWPLVVTVETSVFMGAPRRIERSIPMQRM
jgi:hypothetical protein